MFDKDKWDAMKSANELIAPYVVGCVGYSFVFEPGNHQTGFIFRLSRTNRPRPDAEAKNRVSAAIFWDEGDIEEGDLMLRRDWTGWYAD